MSQWEKKPVKQPLNFHQAMTCNPRSARSPASNAAAALRLGCILLGLTGGPTAAGEVFCAIASSSLNFGSVSASAGRYFDSYGLVKLDCENLSQQQQNAQVQLRITPGPLCPIAEYQAADGAGLVLAADAAEPQALAPLSLKPQEKLRLELTFPAQLRLGPQTRAGVLEFQCDLDVTLEPTP
jgi:hypothetical protein